MNHELKRFGIEEARGRVYVETLLGRQRYVPLVNSRNGAERA